MNIATITCRFVMTICIAIAAIIEIARLERENKQNKLCADAFQVAAGLMAKSHNLKDRKQLEVLNFQSGRPKCNIQRKRHQSAAKSTRKASYR